MPVPRYNKYKPSQKSRDNGQNSHLLCPTLNPNAAVFTPVTPHLFHQVAAPTTTVLDGRAPMP